METLIQLTNSCNQNCIFCIFDRLTNTKTITNNKNLIGIPTDEAKNRIIKSKETSNSVNFMGGEPLLKKDLIELISFSKKQGFEKINVNTNGSLLYNSDFVRSLRDAGLTQLTISLHSHIRKKQEEISRTKGNYDKTVQGIKNCKSLGLTTSVSIVIYSGNYMQLPETAKFVDNIGNISTICFLFIRPNQDVFNIKGLIPKISEVRPSLFKAMNYCETNNISFWVQAIPPCHLEKYKRNNYHFNMNEEQINNEIRTNDYGAKSARCKTCIYDNNCVGLTKGYAELYGTSELNPIKKGYLNG